LRRSEELQAKFKQSRSSPQTTTPNESFPFYYCLCLTSTRKDEKATRGALIRSFAVITRHKFFHAFKVRRSIPHLNSLQPVIMVALKEYFASPSLDVVVKLFESINQIDLSKGT
jgi:dihydroorotase